MSFQKLKIGFVLDDGLDKPDGVQQYVLGLGSWLQNKGHEVHYLVGQTSRRDIKNLHVMAKNIKVNFNGNSLTIPLLSSKRAINSVLNKNDFDILHVQVPYSPLMGGRIISYSRKNTAVVGTFHVLPYGLLPSIGSKILGYLTRWQNKYFDKQLSVSEPAKKFAKDKFNINSEVLPNFVNTKIYKFGTKSNKNLKIIYVNRLVPRKGCGKLLEALAYARDNSLIGKKVTVDICGSGSQLEELEAYCRKNNLDNVKFHGFVSEDKKVELLSKADIAVYPSLGGESFGIVLLEAMASGCVVIAGDNPGYKSVLNGASESLVYPTNTSKFAKTLSEIVNNSEKRMRLLQKQQKLLDKFDLENVGKNVLAQYYEAKHDKLRKTNG